jgi:hydrogenase maturation protein HypF
VVQGVGFRPFVHRLALRHALSGWVRNASGEVEIAIRGDAGEVESFVSALRHEAPPLARIEQIERRPLDGPDPGPFRIEPSAFSPDRRQPVPPDVALCPNCEREQADPSDRRYRYPFITCTDCGPRYTVIESLPYDRERTTMRAFTQCPACLREYHSPGDRRYHSETNSCPACGPGLWFEGQDAEGVEGYEAALTAATRLLCRGGILAVRGFGGYHLACDATSQAAVAELRRRKRRDGKPFAVMVTSLEEARAVARISAADAELLASQERPVVLVPALSGDTLAPGVAPGLDLVGLMLPATPLHQLLLAGVGRPLVMTSGNLAEEPIAIGNDEARRRLGAIADGFLMHDREILSRVDDSVLRNVAGRPLFLRRARGYAPLPLPLPVPAPAPVLAVGPHLKNTFTVAHDGTAWVSPHIGDLESLESVEHFRATCDVYRRLFRIEPALVAHDLHPGYLSTRLAAELGLPLVAVQHHHAHIAAVLGEHGETGPVIGVAFDGTGYGDDGCTWGAEFLAADLTGYRRLAHLRYVPLPGGDLAARRLWRVALGYASLDHLARPALSPAFEGVPADELALAERQLEAGVNAPLASSMGRLFDAVAAIIGVRRISHYEGQAAMELEALAGRRIAAESPMEITPDGQGGWVINPLPLLTRLGYRTRRGDDPADLAADFHASVAWMTETVVRRAAEETGLMTVALGGGTFQNARLVESIERRLSGHGFRVLLPRRLGPNDGAVSYGQAVVAAAVSSQP